MAYIGLEPSNSFVSLKRQVITGDGTASYTLDHSVASVNDVAIFVNNVRQDPAGYSISGAALTLGGTIESSDDCYVIFLGQALQTVTPDSDTITTAMLKSGAVSSSKLSSGKVLQVVSVVDDTDTSITSATYTDTGLSANITPISTSSKILVTVNHNLRLSRSTSSVYGGVKLLRGSTDIFNPDPIDSNGAFGFGYQSGQTSSIILLRNTFQFLDSPSSTSQVTYKTQGRVYIASNSNTLRFNYNGSGNNGKSIMTLMEVAG